MRALGILLFLGLVAARNPGFWGYLAANPSAFDSRSLRLLATHALGPAALAAALAALCAGLGERILGREREGAPAGAGFALGLGTLASGALLLGLAGLFAPAGFAALGLGAAVLARRPPPNGSRLAAATPPRGASALAAALLAVAAFHALVTALAPPTEWDVLAYHLPLPKLYLERGRIEEIPWLMHSHWPHLLELAYALPLALGRDGAAALLHAFCCAALVRATFVFARQELGEPAAWAAATLLASQPLLLRFAGTAHSDGGWALFHFLAAAYLWSWTKAPGRGRLLLSASLAGFGASTKLFGLIPAAAFALWVLREERRRGRGGWGAAAAYLGLAAALAAPWYLKTWLGAGNPVWPFLPALFGGRWNGPALEPAYTRMALWSWPPEPAAALRYGPQFLLVPALAALAGRRAPPRALRFLLAPLALFLPFVFRHGELWRYLLPFFPAFCLLAAWGLGELAARGRSPTDSGGGTSAPSGAVGRAAKALAAGLWLWGVSPLALSNENNELFAVAGLRSRAAPEADPRELYLDRSLDHHALMRRASAALGPGTKTFLFREIRGYHLDAPYQWGDPYNQGLVLYGELAGPDALHAALRRQGVSHVLVNEALGMYGPKAGYYDARTLALMDGLLATRARPVLRQGGLALYELTEAQ